MDISSEGVPLPPRMICPGGGGGCERDAVVFPRLEVDAPSFPE